MSLIKTLTLKDEEGVGTKYDLAPSAQNVFYDENNSIKDKFDTHTDLETMSEAGAHGIRYRKIQEELQVWKNNEWITISSKEEIDVKIGDVIGATISVNNATVNLTWSDPNDIVLGGLLLAKWMGTKVVRKVGSAPANDSDGVVIINSTVKNQYSAVPLQDTNLEYGQTYYYRFFPYKIKNDVPEYTVGTSLHVNIGRTIIQNVPSPVEETLVYNGERQSPLWNNYNENELEKTENAEIEVGIYYTTFTPKTGYCWSDGSLTGKDIRWEIARAIVYIPTARTTNFVYNGKEQHIELNNWDSNEVTLIGDAATDADNYTLTMVLNHPNIYKWNDGTTGDKFIDWSISPKYIKIPTVASHTLTYTGREQEPRLNDFDSNIIELGNDTSEINCGQYLISFNLRYKKNYRWSDGTIDGQSDWWEIKPAQASCSVYYSKSVSGPWTEVTSSTKLEITKRNDSYYLKVDSIFPEDGTNVNIDYDSLKLSCEYVGGGNIYTWKVTTHNINGDGIVTFSIPADYRDNNWTGYSITCDVRTNVIELVPWTTGNTVKIANMIKGYYEGKLDLNDIKEVWNIGDQREIPLAAMDAYVVRETHRYQRAQLVILDFDHDELADPDPSVYGNKTKALITVQIKDCLMDEDCADGTKYGINNTENGVMANVIINGASWRYSGRRDWCNQTAVNAMKQSIFTWEGAPDIASVYKYTNIYNNGTITNDRTVDKCWLLSEYEVMGDMSAGHPNPSRAAAGEGSHYPYFRQALNNRIKNPQWQADREYGSDWWFRSPCQLDPWGGQSSYLGKYFIYFSSNVSGSGLGDGIDDPRELKGISFCCCY